MKILAFFFCFFISLPFYSQVKKDLEYKIEEYSLLKSSIDEKTKNITVLIDKKAFKKSSKESLKDIENILDNLNAYRLNVVELAKVNNIKLKGLNELSHLSEILESSLNQIGENPEMNEIDLQKALQNVQKNLQLISNLIKNLHDSTMSVIRKSK